MFWVYIMEKKDNFGEMLAKALNIGDLVEWSKWNSENDKWEKHYGIITSIQNESKS